MRPVIFHLRADASGARQYRLVAEEVAKVHRELVLRNSGGRIDGVRGEEFAPMLLNEPQRQRKENAEQRDAIDDLRVRLTAMERKFADFTEPGLAARH